MKTLSVIFLTLVSCPVMAQQVPATIVVDMTMHCPKELTQLSQIGWVYEVKYENADDQQTLTVDFRAGGTAPTFHSYPVGSLIVSRTFGPSSSVPDAPGTVSYKCSIAKNAN